MDEFLTPDAHHDAYMNSMYASTGATAVLPPPPVDPSPSATPGIFQPGGFLGQTDAEAQAKGIVPAPVQTVNPPAVNNPSGEGFDPQQAPPPAAPAAPPVTAPPASGDDSFTTPEDQHEAYLKQDEAAGGFNTPDDGNKAFIDEYAKKADNPLDLYANREINDLDAVAQIFKKKAELESSKSILEHTKDELYNVPGLVGKAGQALAGTWPMIVGGVEAGKQLWDLMPWSGTTDDEKSRAMRGVVAGTENFGQSASGMLNSVQQGIANTPVIGSLLSDLTGKPMDGATQKALLAAGSPVSRPLDPKTASIDDIKQEAIVRKALVDQNQKILSGDVGPTGEAVLKAINNDQSVPTAAQLEARGVPWQPLAVQGYNDIANTLALAIAPEVPLVGEASNWMSGTALKYGGKAAKAAGVGGEAAANVGFKLGKVSLKIGSIGMLAADPKELLNPFALVKVVKAVVDHPMQTVAVAGAAAAAKVIPAALKYTGNIFEKAGVDQLTGQSLLGKENILGQVIGRTAQAAGHGAAANVLYSLPFTQDPTQLAQAAGSGAGLGTVLGLPGATLQSGRSVAFDQRFTMPGERPKGTPPPAPFDYGTDPSIDKVSAQSIKGLPQEWQDRVNGLKGMFKDKAEIYVVPDQVFSEVQAAGAGLKGLSLDQVQAAGVTVMDAAGKPYVFLHENLVPQALYHESGHALWQYLPPDSQNAFYQAALAKNTPDQFLQRYTKDPNVKASDLPTNQAVENGAPRGVAGLTQEDLRSEMGAEGFGRVLNGQTVDQLTKDPTLLRNMSFGLGGTLERLGIPTTTNEAQSILGFKPSLTDGLILDQFIRRQLDKSSPNPVSTAVPSGQSTTRTQAATRNPATPVAPAPGQSASDYFKAPPSPVATIGPDAMGKKADDYFNPNKPPPPDPGVVRQSVKDALIRGQRMTPQEADQYVDPLPDTPISRMYRQALVNRSLENQAAKETHKGEGATPTVDNTANAPDVAPRTPEAGSQEPATAQAATQTAVPKVETGDVQKAWNQRHPEFPATDVSVDSEGNYHVRHPGGDEDILKPAQLDDLGLKGRNAPAKGAIQGATSARMVDATTAEAHTTWFGLNADGSNDTGDVDAHGRNLRGYFGDETHNQDVVGASLPWRTLAGTVGDFTRDPRLMEAIRKGDYKVRVTTADGKSVDAKIVDVGPAEWTRNGLDITYGTGKALGLTDNATTHFQILGPDGKPMELKSAPKDWVPKGGQGAPGESTGPSEGLPPRERNRRLERAPGLEDAPREEIPGSSRGIVPAPSEETPEAPPAIQSFEEQKRLYAQEHDLDLGHAAAAGDRVAQSVLEDRYGKTWLSHADPGVHRAFQENRPEDYELHQRREAIGQQAIDTAQHIEAVQAQKEALVPKMDVLQQIQVHGGLPSLSRLKTLEGTGETMGGKVRRVFDAWKALSPDAKQSLSREFGVTSAKLFSNEAQPLDLMRNDLAQTTDHVFDHTDELLSHIEQLLGDYASIGARQPSARGTTPVKLSPTRTPNAMPEAQRAITPKPAPGLTPEQIQTLRDTGAAAVTTTTAKGKERTGQALAKEQEKAANLAVLEAHAKQLDPADDRVRLRVDPDTGRQVVNGARLDPQDAVHAHLLQGVPAEQIDHANRWTKAIDHGKAVTLTYRSAGASEHSPVGEVRQEEYAADPAAARARGESAGTEATKQVIPLSVRVTGLDSPHRVVHLQALSPDKLLQNFQHIRTALDVTHPAHAMTPDDFSHEVGNYIQNHRAGYRGDGTAPLAGTDEVPVKVDPTYQPKLLGQPTAGEAAQGMPSMRKSVERSKAIGEVINASMHNLTAQGKGPKAERAQGLAKANQGFLGEGGETNPLRERFGKLWTDHTLSSPFEDIRSDNVVKFHGAREKGPQAIRAQSGAVAKALESHGLPNQRYVAAGFMPVMGEHATGFRQAEEEGRTFTNPHDKRKRFEVSDKGMTFKPGFKEAAKKGLRLADAIDHPDLFKNYPFLKDVTVKVDPSMPLLEGGNYQPGHLVDTGTGFAFTPGQINLNGKLLGGYKQTLVHEIQHAIQDHEGLPGGQPLSKDVRGYWNNPGEKEARQAEGRVNRSQEQLDANPPYKGSMEGGGGPSAPKLDAAEVQATYDRLKAEKASGKVSPWDMARELGVDGQTLIQYFKANPMQGRSQKVVAVGFMPMMGKGAPMGKDTEKRATLMPGTRQSKDAEYATSRMGEAATSKTNPVIETPNFKRWFGDSKVVDDKGKPLRVYHGTNQSFESFSPGVEDKTGNPTSVWGHFFTPDPREASRYATDWGKEGASVMPVYLSLKNPYKMSYGEFNSFTKLDLTGDVDKQMADHRKEAADLKKELLQEGHDGIVINEGKPAAEYVAFEPHQIKSATGNTGEFNERSANVNFMPQMEHAMPQHLHVHFHGMPMPGMVPQTQDEDRTMAYER